MTVATSPSEDAYSLASGLSDSVHELALVKRTEARVGAMIQFFGFYPGAGASLARRAGGARCAAPRVHRRLDHGRLRQREG